MPNWCQNVIYVNHEDFQTMESTLKALKEGRLCDHITPMPDVLKDIHSGYCKINGEEHRVWRVDAPRDADWKTQMDAESIPIPIKEQRKIIQKHGHIVPMDWTRDNWGMKWDIQEVSYHGFGEVSIGSILNTCKDLGLHCFKFDTPWCPPIPIFQKMHKLGYVLFAEYIEYGCGYCGQFMEGEDHYVNEIPEDWSAHEYLRDEYA